MFAFIGILSGCKSYVKCDIILNEKVIVKASNLFVPRVEF